MSYYPIELDKVRNFKYGMKALSLIEKKFKKPIAEIEAMQTGALSMEEYSVIMWAGLQHEDKDLTPDKVMELIDEHSSLMEATKIMWEALNSVFKTGEETGETKEKNK
ncbi:hypothetical protein FYJ27_01780 [Anaerosalibacter bizertensis]|jgi:hypothetical protein|uniref:Tail assembly chaperone n=1 Tax=Anaerosalibacter bizertensis TaxID=932217 RepID=A0A844FEQ5_9FIRM|nr:hypothetical protein [Anaerosalibacter bizertensis]MSS42468.1 hypothetical protein [Anaerosalibacter bizertensis]DAT54016.1 MAG TPA: tail tube protein [Caudoviricetes sp.]